MNHLQKLIKVAGPAAIFLAGGVVSAQQAPAPGTKAPASGAKAPVSGTGASTDAKPPSATDNTPQTSEAPSGSQENPTSATAATGVSAGPSNVNAESSVAAAPAAPVAAMPPPAPMSLEPFNMSPAVEPAPPPPMIFPNKLAIGKEGWLQVGALLQGWYDLQWNSGRGERHTKSTFRVRRAEIKLAGDIIRDTASFFVAFDPAATLKFTQTTATVSSGTTINTYAPPGNTGILKLFWVTVKSPYVEASLGQFKYPISYEGQTSSAELLFAERAYSTRYFGDSYDMGFRLEKKFDAFKYQVFLLNGSGQNQIDTNKQKDLAVRLEVTPIEGLMFSAAGLTSIGQRDAQATTKDRIEVDGRLNMSGLLIQGELIWGKTGATGNDANQKPLERTNAAGRYAIIGYTIAKKLQPVIRYGFLNTDKTVTPGTASSYALYAPFGVATDEVRSYEIGLNYYLQGNELKLQASYGYFDFDNIQALQEFTLVAQAAF